jgi:hypothetical protein
MQYYIVPLEAKCCSLHEFIMNFYPLSFINVESEMAIRQLSNQPLLEAKDDLTQRFFSNNASTREYDNVFP